MTMGSTPAPAPAVEVAREFWDRLPFDVRGEEYRADPYRFQERLRERGPVLRLAAEVVVVTGYRECQAVLGDERFGFGRLNTGAQSFLMVDPPEHRRLRTRIAAPFTARAVERLRPAIGHRVAGLLAGVDRSGEVDVIAGLGEPLALDVICALVGVPVGERGQWLQALSLMATGFDPEALRSTAVNDQVHGARLDFARYLRGLIEQRRAAPAGDLVSALVLPGADGSALTTEQVITAVGQLVAAGYEPAVDLIANGLYALLNHPEQLRWLRERPERIPAAVEELLRYDPPIQLLTRVALRDAAIGELPVAEGTVVGLLPGAANRDPRLHPEPHRLDVTRAPQHLSLGWGEHFCLGAKLVRVQAEAMLGALVRCEPVATGEPVRLKPTLISRGLERLPVVLTAGPAEGGHWL
ncbi:cytochrome P450 [Streptomyces orinoci]|uniref:Cytochrome P450 n=1 Tax=Streptomyces orinoci TaxID=67339 RepID=A0ABV3JRK2_STRON|nr:cytochrome P450 [Streptomyces orinoci]